MAARLRIPSSRAFPLRQAGRATSTRPQRASECASSVTTAVVPKHTPNFSARWSSSQLRSISHARPYSSLIHCDTLHRARPLSPSIINHHHHFVLRRSLFIQTTTTPNEDAIKFSPGQQVMPGNNAQEFLSLQSASQSPLARRLLVIEGVRSVFLGPDFITIVRQPGVEWSLLKPEVFEAITNSFESGEPVILPESAPVSDTTILPEDDEVVAMIKELIEQRIKPAVAEDGGNIIFRGFDAESGVVSVELQGACSSCSSSSVTLKMGVQNMLMHYVPEVKQVVEVKSEAESKSDEAFQSLEKRLTDSGILRS
eukprot:CAMPEP_0185846602 /NCGR_PEP_ID=MMETSP1354-20130828/2177_1 /TAXON_ID=708628 /ORGANISM="Erythrolobus madagascarensis, Strain CCMP3276" /LENGTH=311 /DNA_ID=CAMNT_0028546755 /DNA_START=200 /DNA_END=1135 /DNA_ORIENTATION=-